MSRSKAIKKYWGKTIKDELEGMSMNDFSNLVEKHDLGIEEIDQIF